MLRRLDLKGCSPGLCESTEKDAIVRYRPVLWGRGDLLRSSVQHACMFVSVCVCVYARVYVSMVCVCGGGWLRFWIAVGVEDLSSEAGTYWGVDCLDDSVYVAVAEGFRVGFR